MHNNSGYVLMLGIVIFTGFLAYTANWAHSQDESQPFGGQASYGVFAWESDTELWSNQRPVRSRPVTRPYEKASPLSWSQKIKNKVKEYTTSATQPISTTTPTPQSCEGATWTVPEGVRSVKVYIKSASGSLKKSYTITNYISMKPSERVELVPKC